MKHQARSKPWGAFATLTCMVLVCASGLLAVSSESLGTLMRNSLLVLPSGDHHFTWPPERTPPTFLQESLPPPTLIVDGTNGALAQIDAQSATARSKAMAIAAFIGNNARHGGPIRSDTLTAYAEIKDRGRGYCADYSQVFSALSHAANIPVREWGFGRNGFGAGHAFNEIYSEKHSKWIFIDSFHSFYVFSKDSGLPLSVLEFRDALSNSSTLDDIAVVPLASVQFAFSSKQEALQYYASAIDHFYLFWGNNVFSYDGNRAVALASRLSRAFEIIVALIVGVQPGIVPVRTTSNAGDIQTLLLARNVIYAAAILLGLLGMLFVYQVWLHFRRHRMTALK